MCENLQEQKRKLKLSAQLK